MGRVGSLALLCSALWCCRSADVGIVSFWDEGCEDVQYEVTLASQACFRGRTIAVKYDCSIEGDLVRELWRGSYPDCSGESDATIREVPECELSTLFGGASKVYSCLNTMTTSVVRVAYYVEDACEGDSFFDAPLASGDGVERGGLPGVSLQRDCLAITRVRARTFEER